MATIGFLGTGAIASAMVETLSGQGHSLTVSDRNADVAQRLSARFDDVTVAGNAAVVQRSEIVILCLAATVARDVLPTLAFRADSKVISVMADMNIATLASLCAPATDPCVMIPLPSLPSGQSPLVVFPHSELVTELFGKNAVIQTAPDETALNAHFVATAMLLPIMAQINAGATWLARHTDDKQAAETYLTSLLGSYFTLMAHDAGLTVTDIMEGLAIKGGLNDTLNEALKATGTMSAISDTMDQLGTRLGVAPK